jgi:hypothetical protein
VVAIGATNIDVDAGDGNDHITVGDGTAVTSSVTNAEVHGEAGNDTLIVTVTNDASVTGGAGNDSITVRAGDDATVDGGSGNDSIVVTAADDAVVNGDGGNDTITVTAADATVRGGDGNDEINANLTTGGNATIVGGAGNDTINLNDGSSSGQDTVVFGNIVYTGDNVTTNTQGIDVINGFSFEPGWGGTDRLDFQHFLDAAPGTRDANGVSYGDWTSSLSAVNLYNVLPANHDGIAVIAVDSDFAGLNSSHFKTTLLGDGIRIADNSRAVVILATDEDGVLGYDTFDVYFVQDTDNGAGQSWAINHVATIDSATQIGAITTINSSHFVDNGTLFV